MFGIAGTAELRTFCPGTGTWNRLQDGRNGTLPNFVRVAALGSAYQCPLSSPRLYFD